MKKNKITEDEVIQALMICGSFDACCDCPLGDLGGVDRCIHTLMQNALEIIMRQKRKNHTLKTAMKRRERMKKKTIQMMRESENAVAVLENGNLCFRVECSSPRMLDRICNKKRLKRFLKRYFRLRKRPLCGKYKV